MDQFAIFFEIGTDHILDYLNGTDHILFVIALAAVYLIRDWKKVLILITAFTIGHSLTLALATLQIIELPAKKVEFFIGVTIFITALGNVLVRDDTVGKRNIHINYWFALFFGLIHGLGFANSLRPMLAASQSLVMPLFAFNLGLEFGQIIIVVLFLASSFIAVDLLAINRRDWRVVISSMIAGMSLLMMKERVFW